jgi:glycosyltransferase involved in cell wall biosynthesis
VPWSNAPERLAGHTVHQSRLARTPIRRSKPAAALVLPVAWRRMVPRSRTFDWVIASSHLFSHHVRARGVGGDAPKFVYVHSPARYIWNPELDRRGAGVLARTLGTALKPVDRRRAGEAHRIAANSAFVRDRVRTAWERDASVIHPPVDVARVAQQAAHPELTPEEAATIAALPAPFLLGASRFVSYKQLDRVIGAGEAAGLPVVLAGAGPDEALLRARAAAARVPVSFVLTPSDRMLAALYAAATVFVFPALEDFGIMPVEAMAAGTPVVARRQGGTGESVVDGVSGVLVDDVEDDAELAAAVTRAAGLHAAAVRARADDFSVPAFQRRIRDWVAEGLPAPAA